MNTPVVAANAIDGMLEAGVFASFSRIGYSLRKQIFHWPNYPSQALVGKTVVLTGATGGLGTAAAKALSGLGADLWLVGRSEARLKDLARELAEAPPKGSIHWLAADFLSFADVRDAALHLKNNTKAIDVLIHNAGAMFSTFANTEDGNEQTTQLHVLSPFLLTALLQDHFSSHNARVITTTSGGMYLERLSLEQLQYADDNRARAYNGPRAYAQAKRAQVALNDLWSLSFAPNQLAFHAYHPGWTATPGLRDSLPRFSRYLRPFLRSPLQGADTMVWLSYDDSAITQSGKLWLDRRGRKKHRLPTTCINETTEAHRVWQWCMNRTETQGLFDGDAT